MRVKMCYPSAMDFVHIIGNLHWIAGVFMVVALVQALRLLVSTRSMVRTVGKVTEVKRTDQKVQALVAYVTQRGKHCQVTFSSAFDVQDWRKGKVVALRYPPKQPTHAVLDRRIRSGWGRAAALFGFGLLLGVVGLLFS